MLNLTLIGKRISEKRKELKLTQNGLAELLFITGQAVSKWENGKSLPSIDILYELTKVLNVSIDYILDDSDIQDDDYETKFKNYPRDIVLSNYLKQNDWHNHISDIFYLLSTKERYKVINKIVQSEECFIIKDIWPYLKDEERIYLLGIIISGKCNFSINTIYHQLTKEERLLLSNKGIHIRNIS